MNYKNDHSLISNRFGFLRFPLEFNPYDIVCDWVITGVPFDLTTSGRSGSKEGPSAIRQVSTHLAWEKCRWPWNFHISKYLKIVDCGDLIFEIGNVEDFINKLEIHARKLLYSGKRILAFGGDHFITLPLLRIYFQFFGKISLLHFDAHTDDYVSKNKFDHGTVFFHALNEDLIDPLHSIQIGIRTDHVFDHGFTILDMLHISNVDLNNILCCIKQIFNDRPVYLTFDIDCLDPSIAPGTGTPVVGGLNMNYILSLLRGLECLNIIGIDIVEVLPAYDNSQITALSAATLALDMLYLQAIRKKVELKN